MRTYSKLDLLRFNKFADARPLSNPTHLLEDYDREYPEKTSEQKMRNLLKAMESQCECSGDMQIFGCAAGNECIHLNYDK